jgi:hypothetical protein
VIFKYLLKVAIKVVVVPIVLELTRKVVAKMADKGEDGIRRRHAERKANKSPEGA